MDEKENTAPLQFDYAATHLGISPTKSDLKPRSKSIGPGGPDESVQTTLTLKDRRISVLNPNVRGILPDKEDAERKAARRKSMANRRVSFAPEATLHTWDVIEYMREHTTSTEHSEHVGRDTGAQYKFDSPSSQLVSDDSSVIGESGATDDDDNDDDEDNDGEEEGSESSSEDIADDDDDATGTAMSFVTDQDATHGSAGSSTSSSLERNLRMAAEAAGTRGIEFDEFGDMSMEMAGPEITNAFQPWVEQRADERRGSASYDQENVNPFQEKTVSSHPHHEQDTVNMDMTSAVGGILSTNSAPLVSSPFAEIPMDLTQAVGIIHNIGQAAQPGVHSLRKRPFSNIEDAETLAIPQAEKKRQLIDIKQYAESFGELSNETDHWDETMDFTRAVGGISAHSRLSEASFDGNEELSMELTTVLGGIKAHHNPPSPASRWQQTSSPFRIEVDPTVNRDTGYILDQQMPDDAQSPTPKAKHASGSRRSSARLRRTSTLDAASAVDSSPTKMRQSRRRSAASPARSPASDKVSAQEQHRVTAASAADQIDGNVTPRSNRRTRSASRSPKQTQSSPAARPVQPRTPPREHSSARGLPETPVENAVGQRSMLDAIRLMTTPRKETLKAVTPKKATPSPSRRARSASNAQQKGSVSADKRQTGGPLDDAIRDASDGAPVPHIRLQDFLDVAGIRFMDLTTSKRRLTTATTPSKLRRMQSANDDLGDIPSAVALDEAIVATACTEPELELFKHACHELKRYIDEGKEDIKVLEAETYRETPVLIQAYMAAGQDERQVIDAQMRDIKANARLRSKEMWYGWRSNLVDDLMKALQCIAEGLLEDDETLQKKERLLGDVLPPLLEQKVAMQAQADELISIVNLTKYDDKQQLDEARKQLLDLDNKLLHQRMSLEQLQAQLAEQDRGHDDLSESKDECLSIIRAIDDAKAARQRVPLDRVADLRNVVDGLENDYEWTIRSATSDPPVLTVVFRKELELFFHPDAFAKSQQAPQPGANAPIGLAHLAPRAVTTAQRFFVQLLQAYLQTLVQSTTKVSDMLSMVANTWDCACQIIETERLLAIEGPTKTTIQSHECLAVEVLLLLPFVQTKISVTFRVTITLSPDEQCEPNTEVSVKVVYGQAYNEKNMSDSLSKSIDMGFESWPAAVQKLRTKLVETGPKGILVG